MIYALGAVKPWVRTAANDVGNRFGVSTIYGVGLRPDASSDHPKGLALDYMVYEDQAKGDAIAAFMQQNASSYSVQYIIWKQHIWNISRASEGWRAMPDRGSITANHYDHVHVSFQSKQSSNPIPPWLRIVSPITNLPQAGEAVGAAQDTAKAVGFLTDSHNWLRVGMFALGLFTILLALVMLGGKANGVTQAVKVVSKSAK